MRRERIPTEIPGKRWTKTSRSVSFIVRRRTEPLPQKLAHPEDYAQVRVMLFDFCRAQADVAGSGKRDDGPIDSWKGKGDKKGKGNTGVGKGGDGKDDKKGQERQRQRQRQSD